MRKIMILAIGAVVLCPFPVSAQDTALTRNVALQEAGAGKQLLINQVDTSQFPNVNIFATVLDSGVPVPGLTDKDFRVREDEVDQEPIKVVPRLSPLSVVVTLDTSGSMSKAMAQTKEAAKSFLDSLDGADNVMTLGFARGVNPLSAFSTDKTQGKTAIDSVVARGDTALYDALYASVEALKSRPGRKAVALLSDGVDDDGTGKQLSNHSVDEVLALAREVNVPIYTIGLGTQIDKAVLERVAQETGARYFSAPTVEELKQLYASLGKQLSGQYNILYTSNLPGDGSPHRVQLGQGSLNASKEYLSPKTAGALPAVAAAPPPPPSREGEPMPISGGVDFASAVLIEPDKTYIRKAGDAGGQFFRLQIPQAFRLASYAQVMGYGNAEIELYDSAKKKAASDICAGDWCQAFAYWSASKESDGNYYMTIPLRSRDVVFGFFLLPAGDLGQQLDAGAKEKGSLQIEEGVTYTSALSANGDQMDSYKIKLPAGKKRFRARPAVECTLQFDVMDENGSISRSASSPNSGAGFARDMEFQEPGTYFLRLETNSRSTCAYSFIIGNPDVEAPEQPENPVKVEFPNFRK